MRFRQRSWSIGLAATLVPVLLLSLTPHTASSQPIDPPTNPTTLSGWFHAIWGDRPPADVLRSEHPELPELYATDISDTLPGHITRYGLINSTGQWTELDIPPDVQRTIPGIHAIDRQRIVLTGQWQPASQPAALNSTESTIHAPTFTTHTLQLDPLSSVAPDSRDTLTAFDALAAAPTSKRWVTVLCRFGDSTNITPFEKPWFETLMLGTTAPGMNHYWQSQSFGAVNLNGSLVVGWFNLPQPRSYYVPSVNGTPTLNHELAARDCTAAAEGFVNFPDYDGINLAFNGLLDCCAWGGSLTLQRNGQTKLYNMTWLPTWAYKTHGAVGHEMGHGFGLPHSSGPYANTYDSRWDVMSNIWSNCWPKDPQYGCVGVHTIGYHKDYLKWIPTSRRYIAAPASRQTITLNPLHTGDGTDYLVATIPINGSSTQFYTVEKRQLADYDVSLPNQSIIIHRVDTTLWDRNAQVVDTDNNGNPNDEGAMWPPGDTFVNDANGIRVAVLSSTPTATQVEITNGGTPIPTFTLLTTKNGQGIVTGPGISCGNDCQEAFAAGTAVTLSASPHPGWVFSGWSGDADCSDGRVTLTRDITCQARFLSGPDLVGQFTAVAITPSKNRKQLQFTIALRNAGTRPALSRFSVAFYISSQATFDKSSAIHLTDLQTKTKPMTLSPGTTTTLSHKVILRNPNGTKYLFAVVDNHNHVVEGDENNNLVTASIPTGTTSKTQQSSSQGSPRRQ